MTDDPNRKDDSNAEAFNHRSEPIQTGPTSPTPDPTVISEESHQDEPIDVEPEARTIPWFWIILTIIAVAVLYFLWL